MKIGILTLPLHTNYGGILQAYALQTVLERMGHETYVMVEAEKSKVRWFLNKIDSILIKYKDNIVISSFIKKFRKTLFLEINSRSFIKKYIHTKCVDFSLNRSNTLKLDAIVVGSDQVWRPKYVQGRGVSTMFLDFAANWDIQRLSYAASLGTDVWEYTPLEEEVCYHLIKNFKAISVREQSSVKLLKMHFGVDVSFVLDPTMLLEPDDYLSLCHGYGNHKGNLLCYVIDHSEQSAEMIKIAKETLQMVPFVVNSKYEDFSANYWERKQPPVENWITGFAEAQMVITDSFHACVFSILFNKPFWVVENKKRGIARIKNLLETFSLGNRILSADSLHITDWHQSIDWKSVNHRRMSLKQVSLLYLQNNLTV